jgi:hypothetical protein
MLTRRDHARWNGAAAARSPFLAALLVCTAAGLLCTHHAVSAQNDLDELMRQVLLRRDDNWKKLQQYVLEEREQIELRGSDLQPLWGERREYAWYIRDGLFVRSPTKFNGVEIGEEERRKYEAEFLRRAEERERRAGAQPSSRPRPEASEQKDGAGAESVDALLRQVREPQFVSAAYFLRFRFEQGSYALVGRETLEGHDVLRVEYYPTNLFTDRQRRRIARDHDPRDPEDQEIHRMLNKVALVTLWIEPKLNQIVKYTFDNVDLDFLPAQWLVRVGSLRATMTMAQPFPEVWLPAKLEFTADAQIATGRFDVRWVAEYHDYRQADVSSSFRVGPER